VYAHNGCLRWRVAPRASLRFCVPEVGYTSGFTAPAGCPRWGHHGEARGVPHPLPPAGYRIHHIIPKHSHATRHIMPPLRQLLQALSPHLHKRQFGVDAKLHRRLLNDVFHVALEVELALEDICDLVQRSRLSGG
jgi:hypothetical protein